MAPEQNEHNKKQTKKTYPRSQQGRTGQGRIGMRRQGLGTSTTHRMKARGLCSRLRVWSTLQGSPPCQGSALRAWIISSCKSLGWGMGRTWGVMGVCRD